MLKVGDAVHKGQTVAILEPLRSQALDPRSRSKAAALVSAAEASLAAAEARERAAGADADYTGKRLERLSRLFRSGSLARDQLDQIEAENRRVRAVHVAAKAAVDGARSELERARTALKHYAGGGKTANRQDVAVLSPVDGHVFKVFRESEGAVQTGEPLLEVGNRENLEVRVEVLSADAVKIRKGTPVYFRRWGGEGGLTGIVRIVEPAGFTKISSLGVEEQRVLVIVEITSPFEVWRSLGDGFRVDAHFILWEEKDVLQVPATALFRSGAGWAVYVDDGGRARLRVVEVGRRGRLHVQILQGIKEGEAVVAHPDEAVKDGTRIRKRT
jgi:HlyD family secretion protein